MDGVFFSFLVCTLNRQKELRRCIDSLMNQSDKDYEIIIVDQSDTINTDYDNLSAIKYIHINKKGLSNARNVGLKEVNGKYIALIDDDAIYDIDYLEKAKGFITNHKNIGIVAGRGIDATTNETLLRGMNVDHEKRVTWNTIFNYCISAAMIIEVELLKDGFDDRFGIGSEYGAGEETDIVIKSLGRQKDVFFNPEMKMYHPKTGDQNTDFERIYRYNMGFGALMKKHMKETNRIIFLYLYIRMVFKSCVGAMLWLFGIGKYEYTVYALKGRITGFRRYD